MKKQDLIKRISTNVEITQEKANKAINEVFEAIAEAMERDESYNQDKFGTFKPVTRKARKGRNPQTGEPVDIPAKKAVKLVVSGALKDRLNK